MELQLMQLRKAAGYKSRDDFAKVLGVNPRTYKTWETGERNISFTQACMVADALNCSLDELAGRTEHIGKFSDGRQAEINEVFGRLDDANKSAAVGAVRGIASNQAREKTGSDGLPADNRRTA